MYRRLLALIAAAAAAAAVTAALKVVTDKIDEKKEKKEAEAPADDNDAGDDEVNFISLDEETIASDEDEKKEEPAEKTEEVKEESEAQSEGAEDEQPEEAAEEKTEAPAAEEKPAEEDQAEEEEAPHIIPIESGSEEEPEKKENDEVDYDALGEHDGLFPEAIEEIAKIYPYLTKKFIAEQFARNDQFTLQYPDDTLVTISHKAKFDDAETLEAYTKIAEENGYAVKQLSDTENIVSKKMFTENGSILSDIYNVANQVNCLKGTYEGYNIEM